MRWAFVVQAAGLFAITVALGRASEPAAVSPVELPVWFGARDAPPQRIAGMLLDDNVPIAGTIHLRAAVPDPSVWPGVDREVGADGRFDFGVHRAGRYRIFATAPGKTSRYVEVGPRDMDELSIYLNPCSPVTTEVTDAANGGPIEGASIDFGGVPIATSDEHGRFDMCLNRESLNVTVRAPGYAPGRASNIEGRFFHAAKLVRPGELRGRVVDRDRRPRANVAVQPIGGDGYRPVAATTDADGRFVIRDVPGIARSPFRDTPMSYSFRVFDHEDEYVDHWASASTGDPTEVLIRAKVPLETEPPIPAWNATIAGRVVRHGKPLPDVAVYRMLPGSYQRHIRTAPDGSFVLGLYAEGYRATVAVDHANAPTTYRTIVVAPGDHIRDFVIDVADEPPRANP